MSSHERRRAQQIGRRIRQARLDKYGMTQKQLADALGVSERSVSAYETGEVIPYHHMERLEVILEKPVTWFLHGADAAPAPGSELEAIREELHTLAELVQQVSEQITKIAEAR